MCQNPIPFAAFDAGNLPEIYECRSTIENRSVKWNGATLCATDKIPNTCDCRRMPINAKSFGLPDQQNMKCVYACVCLCHKRNLKNHLVLEFAEQLILKINAKKTQKFTRNVWHMLLLILKIVFFFFVLFSISDQSITTAQSRRQTHVNKIGNEINKENEKKKLSEY